MQIDQLLRQLKREFERIYGDRLKDVVLYGSWARGEATEDSDIDIAVVLEGPVVPGKEIDRLVDIVTDLNLKNGVLISLYPVSQTDFSTVNSPLLMNLRREGVRI